MTHYTRSYDHTDEAVNHANAIADVKDYIGKKQFKEVSKAVHLDPSVTRKSFIFQLNMFAGIEGYPAEAWADELNLHDVVKTSAEIRTNPANTPCNPSQTA